LFEGTAETGVERRERERGNVRSKEKKVGREIEESLELFQVSDRGKRRMLEVVHKGSTS
jgi:hypothetical protein